MKKSLQLAYALSTHKSQGSQYRRVIFVALMRDSFALLDRALIYTAITRTQKQCVVVGETAAFWAGINKRTEKKTVLQQLAAQQ
jgi:exodeoxyribonuclease V alpha subunit